MTEASLDADRLGPGNQGAGPSCLCPFNQSGPRGPLVPVLAFSTADAEPPRILGDFCPSHIQDFSQTPENTYVVEEGRIKERVQP